MFRVLSLSIALSFVAFGSAAAEEGASCPLHAKKADKSGAASADSSALGEVDQLLAEKCACKGKGDCTCKKGQCKCAKCGSKKHRMFDSVKGAANVELPANARHDATGGVFI